MSSLRLNRLNNYQPSPTQGVHRPHFPIPCSVPSLRHPGLPNMENKTLFPSCHNNHHSYHPSESNINSYQIHTLSPCVSELAVQPATANPCHFGHDGTASGKIVGSFSLASAASKTCQTSFTSLSLSLFSLLFVAFRQPSPGSTMSPVVGLCMHIEILST